MPTASPGDALELFITGTFPLPALLPSQSPSPSGWLEPESRASPADHDSACHFRFQSVETRAPVAPGMSLGKLFRRQPCQMAQASLPEWHLQGHLLIFRAWAVGSGREHSKACSQLSCPQLPRRPQADEDMSPSYLKSVLSLMGRTSRSGKQAYATSHLGQKTGTPIPTALSYMNLHFSVTCHSVSSSAKWGKTT